MLLHNFQTGHQGVHSRAQATDSTASHAGPASIRPECSAGRGVLPESQGHWRAAPGHQRQGSRSCWSTGGVSAPLYTGDTHVDSMLIPGAYDSIFYLSYRKNCRSSLNTVKVDEFWRPHGLRDCERSHMGKNGILAEVACGWHPHWY